MSNTTGHYHCYPDNCLRRYAQGALLLLMIVWVLPAHAQQSVGLDSIGFANLPGDSIQIELNFDGVPPEPSSFVLDNPARISLDLLGVESNLGQQRYNIDSNNAQSVMVLDDGSRTRLVVNLDELVGYETQVAGNTLTIQVERYQFDEASYPPPE